MSDADLDDLSALDAQAPLGGEILGNDAQTLKQIRRRSSPITKVVGLVIVLGMVGMGIWAYLHNKAYDARMDVFAPIADMESAEQRDAALREVLANAEFKDVRERAIMNLGHDEDTAAVPLLIENLQYEGTVRRSAAWALARIGSPDADQAEARLLEVLPETGDIDRNQVVWTLAVLGAQDQAFIDALIDRFSEGHLQELDGFDDRIITRVLGIERLSSEQLTNHEIEGVRVLTAHALSEAGGEPVVAPLSRMLTQELAREGDAQSAEVIRATAAGLGRTGSPNAAEALFAMLSSHEAMNDTVMDALKKSTAATELIALLGRATNDTVRRDLTRLIVDSHDRRSIEGLTALLTDTNVEIKGMAALALAEFGERSAAPVLLELTAVEDDDDLVSSSLEHLRYVASPEITAQLAGLLETHAFRKSAILLALGATGDPGAARYIEPELAGHDANSAARALADLDHDGAFRTLLAKVVRPSDTDMTAFNAAQRSLVNEELLALRRAAIMAMGYYGRVDAVENLMEVVEDENDDYELRAKAAAAIGQVGTAEQIATVLNKINDATLSEAARRYYVQALWQRPHRELNAQLLDLVGNAATDVDVRRAAALALGYAGDEGNDARLMSLLDDEGARRHAAFAVVLGGGEEAVRKLVGILAEDRDLREILQGYVENNENDWFNLLTTHHFESGAIWRRLRAGQILREGDADLSYSYSWLKTIACLRTGWNGVGGIRPQDARDKLWEALEGEDIGRRELAASVFGDLPELGLLLRARDEGGEMGEVARSVLDRGRR